MGKATQNWVQRSPSLAEGATSFWRASEQIEESRVALATYRVLARIDICVRFSGGFILKLGVFARAEAEKKVVVHPHCKKNPWLTPHSRLFAPFSPTRSVLRRTRSVMSARWPSTPRRRTTESP